MINVDLKSSIFLFKSSNQVFYFLFIFIFLFILLFKFTISSNQSGYTYILLTLTRHCLLPTLLGIFTISVLEAVATSVSKLCLAPHQPRVRRNKRQRFSSFRFESQTFAVKPTNTKTIIHTHRCTGSRCKTPARQAALQLQLQLRTATQTETEIPIAILI